MTTAGAFRPTGAGTRIYLRENVLDAARARIRWIFNEFDNVIVRVSGGKDSTVVLYLALEAAEELGRLPLNVYWLDQEAEWESTVEIIRGWMYDPRVRPLWLQVPFRIFNASSQIDHWLHAWDPEAEDKWIHPQDPIALTENVYGTDRFAKLFTATLAHEFQGQRAASIAGVRCEESPNRRKGLTYFASYKHVTWAKVENKANEQFAFYPIYDWSYRDVWKAILDHGWPYNDLYDRLYSYGIPVRQMRVSNLHHETAVKTLFYLQEIEPDTYERLVERIGGIDMAGKLGSADYFPTELPFMFGSWREYRDYLLETLVEPDYRPKMARKMNEMDRKLPPGPMMEKAHRQHVKSILTCDWECVKLSDFMQSPEVWQAVKDNKSNWLPRQ